MNHNRIIACLVGASFAAVSLTSCNIASLSDGEQSAIGIIGGADGPTSIFVTNGESSGSLTLENDKTATVSLSNPLTGYEKPDFLEKAGFCVTHLPSFADDQIIKNIFLINDTIAEIRFELPSEKTNITLRIVKQSLEADAQIEDISGVYNTFESESVKTVGGVSGVTIKTSEKQTLALWNYDGFTYSFYAIGNPLESFEKKLEQAVLYTLVSEQEYLPVLAIVNTAVGEGRGTVPNPDYSYGDDDSEQSIYNEYQSFIVKESGSTVEICDVEFSEDGKASLQVLETVVTDKNDFCIRINGMIPEGLPRYAVKVTCGDKSAVTYVSYDGRGEKPTFAVYAGE